MLAVAAAIAQAEGLSSVVIGCNFSDHDRFPDCRREFIKSMNEAFKGAYGVAVHAPLLMHTKAMIREEASRLGLPETWTCYAPTDNGTPCGECYSCKSLQS